MSRKIYFSIADLELSGKSFTLVTDSLEGLLTQNQILINITPFFWAEINNFDYKTIPRLTWSSFWIKCPIHPFIFNYFLSFYAAINEVLSELEFNLRKRSQARESQPNATKY